MDVFYEESAKAKDSIKAGRKYKIIHYASIFFLVLGILGLMFIWNMPLDGLVFWLFICAWFFIRSARRFLNKKRFSAFRAISCRSKNLTFTNRTNFATCHIYLHI